MSYESHNFFDARANSFLVMRISFGMQGGVESLSLSLSLSPSLYIRFCYGFGYPVDISCLLILSDFHSLYSWFSSEKELPPSFSSDDRERQKKLSRNQIAMIALETRRF